MTSDMEWGERNAQETYEGKPRAAHDGGWLSLDKMKSVAAAYVEHWPWARSTIINEILEDPSRLPKRASPPAKADDEGALAKARSRMSGKGDSRQKTQQAGKQAWEAFRDGVLMGSEKGAALAAWALDALQGAAAKLGGAQRDDLARPGVAILAKTAAAADWGGARGALLDRAMETMDTLLDGARDPGIAQRLAEVRDAVHARLVRSEGLSSAPARLLEGQESAGGALGARERRIASAKKAELAEEWQIQDIERLRALTSAAGSKEEIARAHGALAGLVEGFASKGDLRLGRMLLTAKDQDAARSFAQIAIGAIERSQGQRAEQAIEDLLGGLSSLAANPGNGALGARSELMRAAMQEARGSCRSLIEAQILEEAAQGGDSKPSASHRRI